MADKANSTRIGTAWLIFFVVFAAGSAIRVYLLRGSTFVVVMEMVMMIMISGLAAYWVNKLVRLVLSRE